MAFALLSSSVRGEGRDGAVPIAAPNLYSVRISLLTCQPRQEIYALYGHTAIRIEDLAGGTDMVVNYGIFSFSKSWFALRFMFGLTDYTMSVDEFGSFAYHYASVGSGIRQQRLNLTAEEKGRLLEALGENYRPENRVYRYNYFYDNCTTRARDIIERSLSGRVDYRSAASATTYRDEIHQYNADHPWARLGNDLLLGVGSDREIGFREQQFLPEYTMRDFGRAQIVDSMGNLRQLVEAESWAIEPGTQVVESEFPLRPSQCAWIIMAISLVTTALDWRRKRTLWAVDAIFLTACAACGVILLAMVFSQHPTVRLNFQILMFNPLLLVFGVGMVKSVRRRSRSRAVAGYAACLLLLLLLGFWQHYAEGVAIVAAALLLRYGALQLIFEERKR